MRSRRIGPWPKLEHVSDLDGRGHVADAEVVAVATVRGGLN
jgi:hypothetical protein